MENVLARSTLLEKNVLSVKKNFLDSLIVKLVCAMLRVQKMIGVMLEMANAFVKTTLLVDNVTIV